jgi:hypothetical protein
MPSYLAYRNNVSPALNLMANGCVAEIVKCNLWEIRSLQSWIENSPREITASQVATFRRIENWSASWGSYNLFHQFNLKEIKNWNCPRLARLGGD